MEVAGLVGAVPGLINLARMTIGLLRDVSQTRKTLSKVTKGLELQIHALLEVLQPLTSGDHSDLLSPAQRPKLCLLVEQMREQVESLKTFLSATLSEHTLRRIWIIVQNPKKKLAEDIQKLGTSINILKLHLLEYNTKMNEGEHTRDDLGSFRHVIHLTSLIESARQVAAAVFNAKKSELRNLLNPSGHDFISGKLSGTLDWINSNPVFNQWLTASSPPSPILIPPSRLLVIHGPKGSEKSVLAASTIDLLISGGRPCVFFSFFHGSERQRKRKTMLSTVLWQMHNFQGLSSETLSRAHDTLLNSDSLSLAPLQQAIESVASTLKGPFYLVVDGIDESDDWGDIEGPLKMIEEWMGHFDQLYILLAGRQSVLHSVLAKYPGIELSEHVTRSDISKFVKHKIQESRHLNAMPEDLRDHVQQTLQDKSTGMFLWVELVFKELQHCPSPNSVRDCLEDLPQDLEDEYARLFSRLTYRLHSRVGRPTPPVKTARALLALLMSALEPLTIDDLRHAYAASRGKGQDWEGELITRDAVFDLIGDFVACTGSSTQHVHFCHSSLEEFLRLPQEKWIESLKDVEFFRLEDLECHKLMARACLEYIKTFDFGYPLTENTYQNLATKAFLSYAARHWSLHLFRLRPRAIESPAIETKLLKDFIACPSFGGLIEFFVIASRDEDDFFADCASGIIENDFEELLPILQSRVAQEGAYRIGKFGPDDPRSQSWGQIQRALCQVLLSPSRSNSEQLQYLQSISPVSSIAVAGLEKAQYLDNPDEASSQMLPPPSLSPSDAQVALGALRPNVGVRLCSPGTMSAEAWSGIHEIILSRTLPQELQIFSNPKPVFNQMIRSFVARLSIPMHLMFTSTIVKDKELVVTLLDLARQRTEGHRTIYRAWALMNLLHYSMTDEEKSKQYQIEVHEVLLGLEDNPITRRMMYNNIYGSIMRLNALDCHAEISGLIDDLLNHASKARARAKGHRRRQFFYSIMYTTDRWRELYIKKLSVIAETLSLEHLYGDAARVYAHVCACARAHHGIHAPMTLYIQLQYVDSLIFNQNLVEAKHILGEILVVCSSGKMQCELYLARFFMSVVASLWDKVDERPKIHQNVLQDLRSEEDESWNN